MKILTSLLVLVAILLTISASVFKPQMHKLVKIDTAIPKEQETKEETLEWNNWHSNVQNELLSSVRAPLNQPIGTINHVEFIVDDNKNITNIKIYTEPEKYSKSAQKIFSEAVREMDGSDVLAFPQNSKRKTVSVKVAAMSSNEVKLTKPEDFSDTEVIKR